jgi:hypothetical protein
MPRLHESLGLSGLSEASVFQWLWGWLTHLRRRGGVMHPELAALATERGISPSQLVQELLWKALTDQRSTTR